MMPANQLWRKRNSLKIVNIDRNAEHELTSIYNGYGLILVQKKRRQTFFLCLLNQSYSSVGRVRFSRVIFSRLRLSALIGPEPT